MGTNLMLSLPKWSLLPPRQVSASRPLDDGYVHLLTAGDGARGEFSCAECGYGVMVQRELPSCPMCRGTVWETAEPEAAPASTQVE
jgi:hypothetical protein